MNPIISRLIVVCLASLLLAVDAHSTIRVQREPAKRFRVLIDASKDGGLWWFPQGQTFNPKQHHQGKVLADFMRGKGWEVIEVPRGEVITFDKLRDVDIVIRPPAFFSYSADEVIAYQQSVLAGTRLLLIGGSRADSDSVAEIFGLRFETRSRFASVKQWIPHALTANIACCELSWTSVNELPPGAVALAWLNPAEANPRPVLGYLPYGKGYVVFVGQALISLAPDRSFSGSLINSIGRYTLEEISQLPTAGPVLAAESPELPPRLTHPIADATLPQLDVAAWRFDWEDIPAAKNYELVVLGPSAAFPLVRVITRTSDYAVPVREGYIAESNLRGWSWRVRAQYLNGSWGPWSRVRRFNVNPKGF